MIELPRSNQPGTPPELTIKVIGLGGAGTNALDRIQLDGFEGAELVCMNTDAQSLAASVAPVKVQLGQQTTRGLGAGGDPEIGYAAGEESADEIRAVLEGASVVFLCAGLGGGTGSGAAPLVANFAREQHALVVAFVTLPFTFEGRRRMAQAEEALASLQQQADVLICFENNRMSDVVNPRAGIQEAFAVADQTISQSVRAVAAILQRRGLIHAGFDELASALRSQSARSLFGFGEADGDNRAHAALERALRSPLMDRGRLLADAHNVLVHVAGGPNMTLNEVTLLMEEFNRHIADTTRILFSTAVDPRLGSKMSVVVLSSLGGLDDVEPAQPAQSARPAVTARPARISPPIAASSLPAPQIDPAPVPVTALELIAAPPERREAPPEAAPSLPVAAAASTPAPVAETPAPAPPPGTARKTNGKPKLTKEEKQEQMLFEPVNRGRFEKSEPTIVDGQDLDVPAFMRMNVRIR